MNFYKVIDWFSTALLFAFCITILGGNKESKTNNISISLSLDKVSYSVGEPISLKVKFKNTSNQLDSLLHLNEDEVSSNLEVRNEVGLKSDFKGAVDSYIKKSYRKLQPNEEIVYEIDLTYHFGFDRFVNKLVMGFYSYFKPGTYTVKSHFFGEGESEEGKKLESNVLTFGVMENDNRERELYEKLYSIYSNSVVGGSDKQQEAIIQLADIVVKYPKYSFYSKALYDLNFYQKKFNSNFDPRVVDEYLNFINSNPNSTYINGAVLLYGEAILSRHGKQAAIESLRILKESNQNTRISEGVENALNHSVFHDN